MCHSILRIPVLTHAIPCVEYSFDIQLFFFLLGMLIFQGSAPGSSLHKALWEHISQVPWDAIIG